MSAKAKKVLFIDRDGTIIKETADEQIDAFEKMIFYPKAFTFLGKIAKELDYELVMITNQDGLGTDVFPEDAFWPVHNFILKSFENEGVELVINNRNTLIGFTATPFNNTCVPGEVCRGNLFALFDIFDIKCVVEEFLRALQRACFRLHGERCLFVIGMATDPTAGLLIVPRFWKLESHPQTHV